MGELESKNRKLVKRGKIQDALLTLVASGGRLGGDALIRQAVESLIGVDLTPPPRMREIVRTTASRLAKRGLLKFESGHYSITPTGTKIWKQWQLTDFKLPRPKRWDKKWRIIIFDIPERKKKIRNEITQIFRSAGFQRLQDSVWVYPYDCEDVIGLLKTEYGIGPNLLYVIADQIEGDKYLRMDFDLIT